MKSIITKLILLSGLFLTGCFPSLYPLYTEDDLVFDQALVGFWEDPDDDMLWIFEAGEKKSYQLTIIDDEEKSDFIVHLLVLGGQTYLDFYPIDLKLDSGFYESHFIRVHTFYHIELADGRLMISSLNEDFIREQIRNGQMNLEILKLEDGQEITISKTEDLQEFILSNGESDELWDDPSYLTRK